MSSPVLSSDKTATGFLYLGSVSTKMTMRSPPAIAALKAGYRHIDSARMYRNEAQVEDAVRESGVPHNQVYVTSKIGNSKQGYNIDTTLGAVDDSLKNFGFDYLDFMLIHNAKSDKTTRLATWRALVDSKAAGKIRSIDVSNYAVKYLEEIREASLETPDINQIEWNIPKILEVAKKHNKSPDQVLVRWSLQRGFALLPKSSDSVRVVGNADVYDFELSLEDVAAIDALDRGKEGVLTWNPIDVD